MVLCATPFPLPSPLPSPRRQNKSRLTKNYLAAEMFFKGSSFASKDRVIERTLISLHCAEFPPNCDPVYIKMVITPLVIDIFS